MDEGLSAGKPSAMTTSTLNDDDVADVVAEIDVREGLLKSLKLRAARQKANIKLSPEKRDELLQDSFPKMASAEGGAKVKEVTRAEYAALRSSLQKVVRAEAKEKINLLRAQLSEYHSVVEDCIAYKSRCEQLEQEKEDLEARNRELSQLRERRIAMLENELAQLRNERHHSSSNNSSRRNSNSDWVSSIISGVSESDGSEDGHPQPASSTQLHRRMNTNSSPHQYDSENDSRRITSRSISPASLKAVLQKYRSDSALNLGAIRPLPFPGDLASHMHPQPQVDQRGELLCPPYNGEGRSPKRRRSS